MELQRVHAVVVARSIRVSSTQNNPYTMTTLKITLIGLPIVEIAIFIWLLIRKDIKQKRKDPVPIDNMPARYEDYEEAFYNP